MTKADGGQRRQLSGWPAAKAAAELASSLAAKMKTLAAAKLKRRKSNKRRITAAKAAAAAWRKWRNESIVNGQSVVPVINENIRLRRREGAAKSGQPAPLCSYLVAGSPAGLWHVLCSVCQKMCVLSLWPEALFLAVHLLTACHGLISYVCMH